MFSRRSLLLFGFGAFSLLASPAAVSTRSVGPWVTPAAMAAWPGRRRGAASTLTRRLAPTRGALPACAFRTSPTCTSGQTPACG